MTQDLNHLPQSDAKGDLREYGLGRQAGRLGGEYGTLWRVRKAVHGGECIARRPVRKWDSELESPDVSCWGQDFSAGGHQIWALLLLHFRFPPLTHPASLSFFRASVSEAIVQ